MMITRARFQSIFTSIFGEHRMKTLEWVELLAVVMATWLIFVGAPLALFWWIGRLVGAL